MDATTIGTPDRHLRDNKEVFVIERLPDVQTTFFEGT